MMEWGMRLADAYCLKQCFYWSVVNLQCCVNFGVAQQGDSVMNVCSVISDRL